MNRIEQVVPSAPAQQSQPRVPRALAGVRRRAAHAMVRPDEPTSRGRRGTSGLAVAIAALAVPVLPSQAFGAASSAGGGSGPGIGVPKGQHVRHHLHHRQHGPQSPHHVHIPHHLHSMQSARSRVIPDPGTMTFQSWTASGWTLTVPERPGDAEQWSHFPGTPQGDHSVPWGAESADPAYAYHPRPVVLPDGMHGEIAAYQVSRARSRAADPDAPESQASTDPADRADSTGPDGSGSGFGSDFDSDSNNWSQVDGGSTDRSTDSLTDLRGARSHVIHDPLIPFMRPANTKQMMRMVKQGSDLPVGATNHVPTAGRVTAASGPAASPCLRAGYPAGKDRHMPSRPHSAVAAMNVVGTHRRTPCAVMVDYLSQARV